MNIKLIVVRPFNGFARGDIVTDSTRITQISIGEHARDVVRVVIPSTKER